MGVGGWSGGEESWSHRMLVALQGWEGNGERNGDVDASVLDKQRMTRKRGPGFVIELHEPRRCRNLQEGREGAAGSRKNVP